MILHGHSKIVNELAKHRCQQMPCNCHLVVEICIFFSIESYMLVKISMKQSQTKQQLVSITAVTISIKVIKHTHLYTNHTHKSTHTHTHVCTHTHTYMHTHALYTDINMNKTATHYTQSHSHPPTQHNTCTLSRITGSQTSHHTQLHHTNNLTVWNDVVCLHLPTTK